MKLGYWLPRALVIGFTLSLLLPAPDFLQGLDDGQYTLWLARILWVIAVPAVFGAILLVIACFSKNKNRHDRSLR
ncbi:MAG: hypothetical protein GY697_11335 [Desulfobacterales bacterium]|nr:hypothetical protein [Desulfobacterales bacterium]